MLRGGWSVLLAFPCPFQGHRMFGLTPPEGWTKMAVEFDMASEVQKYMKRGKSGQDDKADSLRANATPSFTT